MKPIQLLLLRATLVILLAGSATNGMAQNQKSAVATPKKGTSTLSYKIIDGASGTYGYDIYRQGKLMVHQPSIPALPGNKGFATKARAQKVVGLVIRKIQQGEMPPTVSIEEMKSLKAL